MPHFELRDLGVRDFSALVSLISAAGLAPRLWSDVLDRLGQEVGFAVHMIGFDRSGLETGFLASQYDTDYLNTYAEYYANQNPWAERFLATRPGYVMDSREMCATEDLMRTEFYNDWVRPQGDIYLGGGTQIENSSHGSFVIGGNIPAAMGDDTAREWLGLVALLFPHLRHSWQVARTLTAARLGPDGAPLFLLSKTGRILFANEAGEAVLDLSPAFDVRRRQTLTTRDGALRVPMDEHLATLDCRACPWLRFALRSRTGLFRFSPLRLTLSPKPGRWRSLV